MTTFDTELVERWFGLLLDSQGDGDELFQVRPDAVERQVLVDGGRAISAAVGRAALPTVERSPADAAAALLQVYLTGMATGIAGARLVMSDSGDAGQASAGDRLSLVAGLIAGGAAIQVAPDDPAQSVDRQFPGSVGTALEVARTAGTTAAELVVDGADLYTITSAAAAAVLAAGPPDLANRESRYRARALVGMVLITLQRCTAPPGAPVRPPSCGAAPGSNVGVELSAEVTFTMFLSQEICDRLTAFLGGSADEVVVWSEGDRRYFHVHTRMAGEVISEAYASGAVFSLTVGRRE
ncbi:MAG: hypothetical protein ACR2M5_09055 [Nakamurella sp.]